MRRLEQNTPANLNPALLTCVAVLEVCIALSLLCLYKKSTLAWSMFIGRPAGIVLIVCVATGTVCSILIAREYVRCRLTRPKDFTFTLLLNLLTATLAFFAGEILLRSIADKGREAPTVRGMVLPPQRNWQAAVEENAQLIERSGPAGDWSTSYFVPDPVLGWTVGPNRRSPDGMYLSSPEGLRSTSVGYTFDRAAGITRIALVGDSHTFGMEVRYEDTWADELERLLGPGYQVLNFGVDGYGIDQTFLRYRKDVDAWAPKLVIFSVIAHDFERSLSVYPFITFPQWGMPFAKPRFTQRDGTLSTLNVPLPTPESLIGRSNVTELPFLAYEPGYQPDQWSWHFYDHSYLIRFLLASFPRWAPAVAETVQSELHSVNIALLTAVADKARADGTSLIVAYLPSRGDFTQPLSAANRRALSILKEAGTGYADLTPAVASVPASHRFLIVHNTPEANQAIAKDMRQRVLAALDSSR